ncbi:MAG: hypothetical protein E7L01_15860 [Paenibacillus macerans]|uniref:hypothetical protein n=1 Tax=Paenibacillus TaxID=44249 RepID=UPI000EBF3A27|nr:hypothetical protein [Paenibacillus macerans]MDU7474782.1 hypothetical protein [Paenibacillus macerans]MEC0140248.1 hypothetical protein [Paenibacillus macerans]MEC0330521.1 hypothetical protein [Paenibacillus macerans]GBK62669.1 hypothetical protein PbDSM24746_26730 [Paenibacillus macerans]GBK68981.1 hypothetical protein PbJCM17693_26890 [Paenibacillus macerans]
MTKDVLLELSKTLNTEYEIGIWIEAMFFMTWQENIEDSSVTYNEDAGQYKIVIKLKEFNLHTVKKIFGSLVSFIEYQSTFYVREDHEDSFEYYLLSSTDNKKAFFFHVIFQ